MARPTKTGLSYFPFDVDFFSDTKVQFVAAKFGIEGEMICIKLLCKIYRHGYYINWSDDHALLFSNEVKQNQETINQVVAELLKRNFFDKEKFESYSILTSNGIQKRFFEAAKRRKDLAINTDYLINGVLAYINSINVDINPVNVDISTQTKLNKIKEKNNKEKETTTKADSGNNSFSASLPDFENEESVTSNIDELYKHYAGRETTNFNADIKPILDQLSNAENSEIIDIETLYQIVVDSFITLAQSDVKSTRYLLGIIKQKIIVKRADILKKRKTIELEAAQRDRLSSHNEKQLENDQERKKQFETYKSFFEENPKLFTDNEFMLINDLIQRKQLLRMITEIQPKMDSVFTL